MKREDYKSNLLEAETEFNPAMDLFSGMNYKKYILALRRKGVYLKEAFDDFCAYLSEILTYCNDSTYYNESKLQKSFEDFIKEKFNDNAWAKLNAFLKNKGYDELAIKNITIKTGEKAFMTRLPTSSVLLYILVFYLFKPHFVYQFFLDNPIYSLSQRDKNLILNLGEHSSPKKIEEYLRESKSSF